MCLPNVYFILMTTKADKSEKTEKPLAFARWFKRFGVAGFMFFLIKGLLWLIVPAVAVYYGC